MNHLIPLIAAGWNRARVLRLFARLIEHPAHAQHRLVMAGKPWTAELRAPCAALTLDGRVDERAEVSNEQLRALYCRAEALLFPSLAEGFGWPRCRPAAVRWRPRVKRR